MVAQTIFAQLRIPGTGKSGTKVAKDIKSAGTQQLKKVVSKAKSFGGTQRLGGVGYKKYAGDALWLPNTSRPEWLDGSLPGDRGFDPLGLGKPKEYIQMDLDEQDPYALQNNFGNVNGEYEGDPEELTGDALSPYGDAFGIQRFRECELINGRWAMLACLGILVAEAATGVAWQEAGKVELDGASYFGLSLPFNITQLIWIEVILVGGAEIYRNTAKDAQTRQYPGGYFDPLNLMTGNEERAFRLKEAEIKHARLAMTSFLGFGIQALYTGEGALGSLAKFATSLAGTPLEGLEEVIDDVLQLTEVSP